MKTYNLKHGLFNLEAQDNSPNQTENESSVTINNILRTYVFQVHLKEGCYSPTVSLDLTEEEIFRNDIWQ